jgi:hypothetical protein
MQTLVKLWSLKTQLAQGRPFSATEDIFNGALDFIFAATFGLDEEDSIIGADLRHLQNFQINISRDQDVPVDFKPASHPPVFEAILTLTESLEVSIKSPFPVLMHTLLRQLPYMRRARAHKEEFIRTQIERRSSEIAGGDKRRSALDDILGRELIASQKENRLPQWHSRAIYDEVRRQLSRYLGGFLNNAS